MHALGGGLGLDYFNHGSPVKFCSNFHNIKTIFTSHHYHVEDNYAFSKVRRFIQMLLLIRCLDTCQALRQRTKCH